MKLGWFNDAVVTVTQNNIIAVSLKGQVNYQPGVSNQDPVIIRIDVSDSAESCKFNYFSNVLVIGKSLSLNIWPV